MAELKPSYGQRLWEAWKEYEKSHGALSGVELARRTEKRIGRAFDNTKLSKIYRGRRRATVDEHYALAAELNTDPDKLAGQRTKVVREAPEVDLAPSGGRSLKKRKHG